MDMGAHTHSNNTHTNVHRNQTFEYMFEKRCSPKNEPPIKHIFNTGSSPGFPCIISNLKLNFEKHEKLRFIIHVSVVARKKDIDV
jgi:hypothetical protein